MTASAAAPRKIWISSSVLRSVATTPIRIPHPGRFRIDFFGKRPRRCSMVAQLTRCRCISRPRRYSTLQSRRRAASTRSQGAPHAEDLRRPALPLRAEGPLRADREERALRARRDQSRSTRAATSCGGARSGGFRRSRTSEGRSLADSTVIVEYLEERFPTPPLFPTRPLRPGARPLVRRVRRRRHGAEPDGEGVLPARHQRQAHQGRLRRGDRAAAA